MGKPVKPCVYVIAIDIVCPQCENEIPSPFTGSLFWTNDDIDLYQEETIVCDCGAKLVIPRYAKLKAIYK